jgi:sigma54-dependent transcription regulator
MQLSIIVPVCREEGNISAFLRRLLDLSPDRTEEVIAEARDERIKLLKFSRRVGLDS